ncbi:alginate lyase family protein [Pontibacterium granulatum]|uniref:alginate lyase family protein n=1 Tax=Pontibacterium granulatum TaxID=2036029 RepID=UPI00249B191D|nr:alginate lyase family protein [Pontibacterium granulatum]MDI3325744.1 alginate lyase family protein [Pontibacterium granulatum]
MGFKVLIRGLILVGLLGLFVVLLMVESQHSKVSIQESSAQNTVIKDVYESQASAGADESALLPTIPGDYIWISSERLKALPVAGVAWDEVKAAANQPMGLPDLSNQNDPTNVMVLAKALVYARTGEERYRDEVISACMLAIGTEEGGRTLDFGKELIAYVLAADLVKLSKDKDKDARFRRWLAQSLTKSLSGKTLRSTHEVRPNNWGTFAGASRLAIAAYLGDKDEIKRAAQVFKGWLGDRDAYSGFRFKAKDWQSDPSSPVGINPAGATKNGLSVDGVLPDDQRRSGSFSWPPPQENYVYSALQGAVAQAVILHRMGYPVWEWEDQALLRAFRWLNEVANYPAVGDDTWMPHIINYYYGSSFWAPVSTKPGKNVGWSAWTHAVSK